MTGLQLRSLNSKELRIRGIPPSIAACLQELPQILELRGHDAAKSRLFPDPSADDEEANADWRDTIGPELQHLFTSAGETVTRDLTTMRTDRRRPAFFCVTLSAAHVSAWMNALNQARLILAGIHAVDEIDMNLPYEKLSGEKAAAVIRIDLYGSLLHLFVDRELKSPRRHHPRPRKRAARRRRTKTC